MTSPIPSPASRGRRPETEQALLDAAAAVIAERGITGASFTVIGERAGTSRGLPTHHFGSKDGLVARLAERAQQDMSEQMTAAVEAAGAADIAGLELVRLLVGTYLDLFEHPSPDQRALLVMWGATLPSEASIEGLLEAERRSYEGWADRIREGQADGSIRPDLDPVTTAVILHGMLRGVAALVLAEGEYTDMSGVRGGVDAWIERALAARPPGS